MAVRGFCSYYGVSVWILGPSFDNMVRTIVRMSPECQSVVVAGSPVGSTGCKRRGSANANGLERADSKSR